MKTSLLKCVKIFLFLIAHSDVESEIKETFYLLLLTIMTVKLALCEHLREIVWIFSIFEVEILNFEINAPL